MAKLIVDIFLSARTWLFVGGIALILSGIWGYRNPHFHDVDKWMKHRRIEWAKTWNNKRKTRFKNFLIELIAEFILFFWWFFRIIFELIVLRLCGAILLGANYMFTSIFGKSLALLIEVILGSILIYWGIILGNES